MKKIYLSTYLLGNEAHICANITMLTTTCQELGCIIQCYQQLLIPK